MSAPWTDRARTHRPSVPLLALCVLLLSGVLHPDELRTKAAVDLVFRANRYIFRFRPVDHVTPPGVSRIDALVGRDFGALDVYLYGKLNSQGHAYLGSRLDYSFTASEKRLQAVVQVRGFLGLNHDSTDHFYLITHVNYALGEKRVFRPGIMEYGVKAAAGEPVMYLGPSLTIKPSSLWSLRLSYGYDVLASGQLLYLKLYFYL